MIDRRTIELINGEVDGVNTPEESVILQTAVAGNPEARALLEDLKKLERNFSSLPAVPPPEGLKKGIMRSLQERKMPRRMTARRFNLAGFLFPVRPLPRLGFAFGGGVLAGMLVVILYLAAASHTSFDARDASGTLFGPPSESFQTVESAGITVEGAEGNVATEYSGNLSVLRVAISMKPGVTARFSFNTADAKLKGVSLGDEFRGTLTQSEGVLEVGRGGGAFRAFFAAGSSSAQTVHFQLSFGGNVLYERTLSLR